MQRLSRKFDKKEEQPTGPQIAAEVIQPQFDMAKTGYQISTDDMMRQLEFAQIYRDISTSKMKECDNLMKSVIKLEQDGITSESAILSWDKMITSIISYNSKRFGCPTSVNAFLGNKSRCATSHIRGRFVKEALELARATNQHQARVATDQMSITIDLFRKPNPGECPLPKWYLDYYDDNIRA